MSRISSVVSVLFTFIVVTLLSSTSSATSKASLSSALSNKKLIALLKDVNQKYQQPIKANAQDTVDKSAVSSRFAPGEELFLSLNIGKLYLADVYAIKSAKQAHVSLMTLFETLDFPIQFVEPVNSADHAGGVSGWFIREDNTFDLQLPTVQGEPIEVTVNGQEYKLNNQDYTLTDDGDIYVEADAISQWMGLEFKFDFANLELFTDSDTPLPIEQRLARQSRRVNQGSGRGEAVLPMLQSNYQAITAPLVDVQLASTIDPDRDSARYSVLGSHDFAYLNSQFFVAGNDQDELSDVRLTLSKESLNGDLLGPLNATQVQFGDITPVNVGIGNTASQSRGFSVTNRELAQINDNKTINLTGDIQLGWDIELYRNGILIDQQMSLQSGRYEFNDVDLLFGDNQFELIMYGPQGQIESKTEQYFITTNSVEQGEGQYRFSVADVGESLFGVSTVSTAQDPGVLLSGVYNRGITDWFSLSAGVSSLLADEGEDQQYFSLGSNLALFDRVLLDGIVQINQDQQTRAEFGARTRIGDTALSADYYLDERSVLFTDEQLNDEQTNLDDTQLYQQFALNMSGELYKASSFGVNYQNEWRHTTLEDGLRSDLFSNQLSINSRLLYVSHELNWLKTDDEFTEEQFSGTLRLQKSFGRIFTRLNAIYSIKPESQLEQVSTELYMPLTTELQSQLEIIYYPQIDDYRAKLGLNWQHDLFYFTADTEYDKDGDWSVGLNMRFSFGYDPLGEQFFMNRRSMASSGAMAVRVFEDLNLNGQFDNDEPLIENAKIKALQNYRHGTTDKTGVAMLSSMTNNVRTDIVLDRRSLEDPFLINAIPGVSVTPRAGHLDVLDFPVVQSGELEGVVYVSNASGDEEVATYAPIRLYDSKGNEVNSTVTEFDGYYLFTDLLPDDYQMRIDASYLEKKNLRGGKVMEVSLASAGEIVNGADFTLQEREAAEGYVVSIGEFNSLRMLKAFWQILIKKGVYVVDPKPFYYKADGDKKYTLNVAFYPKQAYANAVCARFAAKNILCNVAPFTFDI
ncbi:sporulation protein [Paraglaciecola agarilytica]|uniref:sporulation protein n=1 Tax=Paraglaciecola chathamensis TaxID=368405 RepID=UPI001C098FB4|nr:sporulation protein [Paraglaciecola agarilytica]MBU3016731.1 sporulation protein [Paraglaciecola agarilytica]